MRVAELEVAAMRDRFRVVVERWQLSEEEAARVLGGETSGRCHPPIGLTDRSETSMRLMIELDQLLSLLMSSDEIASWLRISPDAGPDPLAFMGIDISHLRALVQAARLRIGERAIDAR